METDAYHAAEELSPHTWRIDEAGFVNCYLLEGDDAALLIDTGCGAGDLLSCVRALTKKPVLAALTHRHPDHAGGAWRFGSCRVGEEDQRAVYALMCWPCFCRAMLRRVGCPKSAFARPAPVRLLPMRDGYVFELGNRSVLVRSVPGHTRGSVIFADSREKLLFTGDDINPDLWMHLPGCTGLETWCAGADRILALMEDGWTAWNGHGSGRQTPEQARETKRLVLELLEKRRSGELQSRRGSYPSGDAEIVVRYRFR